MPLLLNGRPFIGTASELLANLHRVPEPKCILRGEPGFNPPIGETCFIVAGEGVFTKANTPVGSKSSSQGFQITLWNDKHIFYTHFFNGAYIERWQEIFNRLGHTLNLQIFGGSDHQKSTESFNNFFGPLLAFLSTNPKITIDIKYQFAHRNNALLMHKRDPDEAIDHQQQRCKAAYQAAGKEGIYRNSFLQDMIILPGLVYEVSTEVLPKLPVARLAREFSITNQPVSPIPLLIFNDTSLPIACGDYRDFLQFNFPEEILKYAADRAKDNEKTLFTFFHNVIAPTMLGITDDAIKSSLTERRTRFAEERTAIVYYLAHIYNSLKSEREREKPVGPYAVGYKFP